MPHPSCQSLSGSGRKRLAISYRLRRRGRVSIDDRRYAGSPSAYSCNCLIMGTQDYESGNGLPPART